MICNKCGTIVQDGINNCPTCGNQLLMGTPVMNNMSQNYQMNNMGQNYQMNNMGPNKKNSIGLFIVIGAIVVASIVMGIIIFKSKDSDDGVIVDDTPGYEEKYSNSNSSNSNNSNYSNNSNNQNSNNSTIKNITFKGYSFTFSNDYSTTVTSSNQLQVISVKNREVYVYDILEGSYDNLKKSPNNIKNSLSKSGYLVSNIVTKNYNGVEFITAEVKNSSNAMIVGYSKINSNAVLMVVAANTSYTIDYSMINNAATIAKTIKKI